MDFEDSQEVEVSPLEYVIELGVQGNHILFETDWIREAFSRGEGALVDLGGELVEQIRAAVTQVLTIPDLAGKKQFIASLPREVQHVLVFLYFQMLEKTLLLTRKQYH